MLAEGVLSVLLGAEVIRTDWATRAILLALLVGASFGVAWGLPRIQLNRRGRWLVVVPLAGAVLAAMSPRLGLPLLGYAYAALMVGALTSEIVLALRRGRSPRPIA